ncbi:MAG: cupin domain-containing protein [Thiotrichales bacterium]|nr:cupin domain-containing protein [Thiotrichales bacterium]
MTHERPTETADRVAFYDAIEPEGLTALWSVMGDIITGEPTSACVPFLWRYETVRSRLMEAAGLITAKEAERRVLILENPGLRGQSKVTTSLFAGVQLVMPDEVAPAHRHTQSALRFVLEAKGGHTTVGGERTEMAYGDFVITPNWEWHDHGNTSDAPIFWLDGLDIPLVQFLDASFAEPLGEDEQPIGKPEGDSLARYGANMLPVGYEKRTPTSPIFNYPYERSRDALERMRRTDEWDPCHGLKMRYVNPGDGGWGLPTIGAVLPPAPDRPLPSTGTKTVASVERYCVVVSPRGRSWRNAPIVGIAHPPSTGLT